MKTPQLRRFRLFIALAACALTAGHSLAEELLWAQPSTSLPDWVRNQTIYEINVRQYSQAGTFAAVEADLDRIDRLGARTLWLMPIHPIGELNRKGPLGSYYAVSDYYGINPEFGTRADFKSLVDAAHARGMRVILDWVGNHTAWDNPLAAERPDFYMKDVGGNFIPPLGFDWTDVIQLDFNNPQVLDYQIQAMRYWITEYNIDGFRCDFATGVPTAFWDQLCAALLETRPGLFLLAEANVADHQLRAFHASYGWDVLDAFNAIAQGRGTASHLDDVLVRNRLRYPAGSDFLYMTTNHDKNSWEGTAFERLGAGVEVFSVLSFVLDGIPLIYNGQEAGLDKRLLFFERDPIEWREHRLAGVFSRLCALKAAHPALATGAFSIRIPSTRNEQVYSLMRQDGNSRILLVANLTAHDTEVSLGGYPLAGPWRDAFSGEAIELNESPSFSLRSWGYRLLLSE